MNRNKQGYNTIEQYLYEIEVNNIDYSVQVDVKLFVKPPDYNTYDSDLDFEGYTEILDVKITSISLLDENSDETEVEFSQLPSDDRHQLWCILQELIDKQEIDYD